MTFSQTIPNLPVSPEILSVMPTRFFIHFWISVMKKKLLAIENCMRAQTMIRVILQRNQNRSFLMVQVILQQRKSRTFPAVQVILQQKKRRNRLTLQVILQRRKKARSLRAIPQKSLPILHPMHLQTHLKVIHLRNLMLTIQPGMRTQKKVVQKEEEYPNIDWDNLSNEDVQMATVIYNDRINTWRKMKKLDELLDKKPKANDVAAMAELRIRNLQAFDELKAYNDTGKFLYKHPLLKGKSEFDELVKLFKKDPAEFLHKHKNVLDNIKRYKSYIKRDDRKDKRTSDRENLQRHQERERMFKMVMEQYSDKSEKPDGQDG